MEFNPPPLPWPVGVHPEYTATTLEVHLCEDPTGRVWSYHTFASSEAEQASCQLRHHGVQQIAYALLTEAYRREAFVVALTELSRNPQMLEDYRNGDASARAHLETLVGTSAQEVMRRTLERMGSDIPREVLAMMSEAG